MERRWIRVSEAAALLGIPIKSVYALTASKKIPSAKLGRRVLVDLYGLEADLERQAAGDPGAPRKGRSR